MHSRRTLVTDNFNRANGPLTTPWIVAGVQQMPEIVSNTVGEGVDVSAAYYGNTPAVTTIPQWCSAQLSGTAFEDPFGLAVCMTDFQSYVGTVANSGNQWQIIKYNPQTDSATLLASGAVTVADDDVLLLECTNFGPQKISLYQNGVLLGQVNDTAFSGGAQGMYFTDGDRAPIRAFDSFAAGDFI